MRAAITSRADMELKPLAEFLRANGADPLGLEWRAFTIAARALNSAGDVDLLHNRMRYNTHGRMEWEIDPERHRRKYKNGPIGKPRKPNGIAINATKGEAK